MHPFLAACRRLPTAVTPVWLMRQAGRFLPEYRAIRARVGFLELCHRPDLAAEVTLLPVERLGVDAAILFADILLPVEALGVGLEFARGEGPAIHRPVRSAACNKCSSATTLIARYCSAGPQSPTCAAACTTTSASASAAGNVSG